MICSKRCFPALLTVFSILFLCRVSASAQVNTFVKTYVFDTSHVFGDNLDYRALEQTKDRGYILFRGSCDTGNTGSDQYVDLIRLDRAGDLSWGKRLHRGAPSPLLLNYNFDMKSGNTFTQTSDGGMLLATSITSSSLKPVIILIRTDSLGTVIWSKQYPGDGFNAVTGVKQTADSGFIVCGNTSGLSQYRFPYLFKTDPSGNLSWGRRVNVGTDTAGMFFSVEEIAGQGYIAVGNSGNSGLVVKTDLSGNLLWNKNFFPGYGYLYSSARTTDSAVVAAGAYIDSSGYEPSICLVKLDFSGRVCWQKQFTSTNPNYFGSDSWSLIPMPSGNFAMGGYMSNPIPETFIALMDSTGNSTWFDQYYLTYHTFNYESFSLISTTDQGFGITTLAGTVAPNGIHTFSTGFIKTDSAGITSCDGLRTPFPLLQVNKQRAGTALLTATGTSSNYTSQWIPFPVRDSVYCQTIHDPAPQGVVEHQQTGFELDQNIPNPFSSITDIRYTLQKQAGEVIVEVFDALGACRLKRRCDGIQAGAHEFTLHTPDLAPGMYFYTLIVDGFPVIRKMIVE
jgi:hypothetical protein